MSEMVERVAQAIEQELMSVLKGRVSIVTLRPLVQEATFAAIAAMREPTERMKTIGDRASLRKGAHDCEVPMSSVWRAMIDEALK